MNNPWRLITSASLGIFVLVALTTYSFCQGNSSCSSPLRTDLKTASPQELKSQLLKTQKSLQTKKAKNKKKAVPREAPLSTSCAPAQKKDSALYTEKISLKFLDQLSNMKVIAKGSALLPCDLEYLAMGLAPFQKMLQALETTIIISYESLGPGYRAVTSRDGKEVILIAPKSYQRVISPHEFVNLVRHEMAHVFHIVMLDDEKKQQWENLIHTDAHPKGVLSFSEYGATRTEDPMTDPHVYESLAEDMLSFLLFGREEIASKRPEFLPAYDFLQANFPVEGFGQRRYQGAVDFEELFPSGKDATRLIAYPLPEVTHE